MPRETDHAAVVRRYFAALEAQVPAEELAQFFAPDVVLTLLPNRLQPQGETRDLAEILRTAELGRKVIAKQKFDVLSVVAHGDALALEVLWTGTLAVAAGTRKAGSEVRVHSAMFFEFRGGRIASQRNYDCFEEW